MSLNPSESNAVNQARIAREARVSQSTVSRVLNDSSRVNPEKKKRVLDTMERLSYRPNTMAQGLARGRSMTIGVLTPHISSAFFGEILGGIEAGLRGGAYHPIYASADLDSGSDAAHKAIELLVSRRVDAIIILQTQASDETLFELSKRLPLVVVGRTVPGLEGQCVTFDNAGGAYLATKTLIELGHTKIAHVSGPLTHEDAFKRRAGYLRALEEAQIEVDEGLIFEGDYLEQSGLMAISALLARGKLFTAVFVGGDLMAHGVRLGLYRQGLRVPEDISLLGFDDMRGTKYFIPPLTTIRQPMAEYGLAAAQISLELLQGRPLNLPSFQPELVRRESLAPLGSARFLFERGPAEYQNSTRAD